MAGKEFPRGGKHLLTPLEVRSVREQAERDVLFGGESTVGPNPNQLEFSV